MIRTILPPLLMLAALGGCVPVTVNVIFTQERIDSAAANIEDLVRGAQRPPAKRPEAETPPAPPAPRSWAPRLGPAVAEAQTPELRVRTPEVMAAVESRRARLGELTAAMTRGCIGENNQGLVETRPGTDCAAGVAGLVAAENRDRAVLQKTLMEQNKMPPGETPKVQAGFARANRERAPAGTWVQDPGGQWTRK